MALRFVLLTKAEGNIPYQVYDSTDMSYIDVARKKNDTYFWHDEFDSEADIVSWLKEIETTENTAVIKKMLKQVEKIKSLYCEK